MDPKWKKNPAAHVLPGSEGLSVAHAGCNLRCLYCQNWEFSQRSPAETRNLSDFTQDSAFTTVKPRNLRTIAFTYTEPTSCPEFVGEMAVLAKAKGLVPTLCTCGFVQPKPMREILVPFAAVTITLKGPTEAFYQKVCQAELKPVLDLTEALRDDADRAARAAMDALRFTGDGVRGLTFERRWTRPGVHPYDEIAWEVRTAAIGTESGKLVFEQKDVEVPAAWSQLATNVVVSKYFRGHLGTSCSPSPPGRRRSTISPRTRTSRRSARS